MNTSDRITSYLSSHKTATVGELSQSLDLTKADIHYHVRKLLSGSLIKARIDGLSKGAGRPARKFELVEVPPLTMTRLLVSLLLDETVKMSKHGYQSESLPDRVAQRILFCCPSTQVLSYSPAVKLNRISNELNSLGFELRWQAGKKGPELIFDREPLSLLVENPVLVNQIMSSLTKLILRETA